jgi:hypothetical protein
MNTNVPLIVIIFFILKHLICDFFLQGSYQFLNKGNLRHPGGYVHAGINGIGTMIVFAVTTPVIGAPVIILLGVLDFVTHYAIDCAKVNINAKMKWEPLTSPNYWFSLGIDQTLHWFIYVLLIYMALGANKNDFGGITVLLSVSGFLGAFISGMLMET